MNVPNERRQLQLVRLKKAVAFVYDYLENPNEDLARYPTNVIHHLCDALELLSDYYTDDDLTALRNSETHLIEIEEEHFITEGVVELGLGQSIDQLISAISAIRSNYDDAAVQEASPGPSDNIGRIAHSEIEDVPDISAALREGARLSEITGVTIESINVDARKGLFIDVGLKVVIDKIKIVLVDLSTHIALLSAEILSKVIRSEWLSRLWNKFSRLTGVLLEMIESAGDALGALKTPLENIAASSRQLTKRVGAVISAVKTRLKQISPERDPQNPRERVLQELKNQEFSSPTEQTNKHTPDRLDNSEDYFAVLFVEICGSINWKLEEWTNFSDFKRDFVPPILTKHEGIFSNLTGDHFQVAIFQNVNDAIYCAFMIQDTLRGFELESRAGINYGSVYTRYNETGDDIVIEGEPIIYAEALANHAVPSEIMVSNSVRYQQSIDHSRFSFEQMPDSIYIGLSRVSSGLIQRDSEYYSVARKDFSTSN
jgi:class 3 adenylate cyclase